MQSMKVIMTLSVRWKKPLKFAITVGPEDVEDEGSSTGITISVWRCHLTACWQSFLKVAIKKSWYNVYFPISGHKWKNPQMPESGFALHKIMHLYINFHKSVLTQCGSYTKLPEWVPRKKTVINPKKQPWTGF